MIIWHSGRQWAGITADKLRIGVEGAPTPSTTSPHRTTREPGTTTGHKTDDPARTLIPDMTATERLGREHPNPALG
ncbi:hypothetical protein [Nocardia brasiliensis]|uniref:hypothetical protein n=1 Tax=Nocardia brasiliensis TaxID=37326 RepID=UPI0033D07A6C